MAAGLQPLRDHRIDPPALQPARLGDGRRGRDDERTGRLYPGQQVVGWQAEMETDDGRLEAFDQSGRLRVERLAAGTGGDAGRVDAELAVIRRKARPPRRLARRIGRWRRVGEEIDVPRPRGAGGE